MSKVITGDEKFDLEKQYELFLEQIKLHPDKMHPTQRKQIKQTFFAAFGQSLILMRDDVGGIENEDDAIFAMQHLLNQVGDFFHKEQNQSN